MYGGAVRGPAVDVLASTGEPHTPRLTARTPCAIASSHGQQPTGDDHDVGPSWPPSKKEVLPLVIESPRKAIVGCGGSSQRGAISMDDGDRDRVWRTSRELELDLRDAQPKCWPAKNVARGFGRPAIPPSPSPQFPEPHPLTHRALRPWLCGATFLCSSGRPQRRDVEGKEGLVQGRLALRHGRVRRRHVHGGRWQAGAPLKPPPRADLLRSSTLPARSAAPISAPPRSPPQVTVETSNGTKAWPSDDVLQAMPETPESHKDHCNLEVLNDATLLHNTRRRFNEDNIYT